MIKIIEITQTHEHTQSKPGLSPQRLAEIRIKISQKHYFSKEVLAKIAEKILDEI